MLKRQKTLLYIFEVAGRPVSRLELTKWAFLLAQEMPSRGGSAFYRFLPYQYGPYSFCLYREASSLVQDGYLSEEDEYWHSARDAHPPTQDLPHDIRSDAARVVERFGETTTTELLDYVYTRFPWYTINSTIKRLESRPVASPAVHTIGYGGCLVDAFLNALLRKGIQRLIDVRSNPVARRYGFHKQTLARLCEKVQIQYVHFPEVGIASDLRRGLDTPEKYLALLDRYEKEILPPQHETIVRVAKLMQERPSVLMCAEADPSICHRSVLARTIAGKTGLTVKHLGADDESRF